VLVGQNRSTKNCADLFFFLETNWHKEKSKRRPKVQNCAPYRMPPTHAARKKKRQSFNLCSTLNIYNLQQKQAWYWFGAATKIVHFLERSFDRALLFPCLTRKNKQKKAFQNQRARCLNTQRHSIVLTLPLVTLVQVSGTLPPATDVGAASQSSCNTRSIRKAEAKSIDLQTS